MDEYDDIQDFTDKDRSRGERRKQDYTKAVSKRNKDKRVRHLGHLWYDNIHQYSKNKIHCSCLMCAFNGKKHGRVVFRTETYSDMKRVLDKEQQLAEYKNAG